LRPLSIAGFNVPVDLEALYTDAMWDRAEQRGWLEDRGNLSQLLSQRMIDEIAAGAPNPFAALVPEDARRLQRKFDDRGKRAVSRMLANMRQDLAETELEAFRPVVVELATHLFPPAARPQAHPAAAAIKPR
jgi:hypothetical protein